MTGSDQPHCTWHAGPQSPAFEEKEVHVWCAPLEHPPERVKQFERLLSDDERQRAYRFKFEHLQRHFMAGRGQLRLILGRYLQHAPEHLQFEYGAQGKPALVSTPDLPLYFNLAHSHGLALVAVTPDCELGVDLEALRTLSDMEAVAKRFFSPQEYEQYRTVSAEKKPRAFFNCWTRKEAYIKAIGLGLTQSLDEFDVTLLPGVPPKIVRIQDDGHAAEKWTLAAFQPAPGYAGALAIPGRFRQIRYWKF